MNEKKSLCNNDVTNRPCKCINATAKCHTQPHKCDADILITEKKNQRQLLSDCFHLFMCRTSSAQPFFSSLKYKLICT